MILSDEDSIELEEDKPLDGAEQDSVLYKCKKALGWHLDMYGLDDMVDDMDLTDRERAWAKENLYITVARYDE